MELFSVKQLLQQSCCLGILCCFQTAGFIFLIYRQISMNEGVLWAGVYVGGGGDNCLVKNIGFQ